MLVPQGLGPLPASPLGLSCPDPPHPLRRLLSLRPLPPCTPRLAPPYSCTSPSASLPGSRSVCGLVLFCSPCPPSHRHDARQFRVWVVVGVARACVTHTTCKVHSSKGDLRRGLCPHVPLPPRPVTLVPAHCFSRRPCISSRWPWLRPWLFSRWRRVRRTPPPAAHAACCGLPRCVAAGCGARCLVLGRWRAGHGAFCAYLAFLSRSCTRGSGRPPWCLFPLRPAAVGPGGGGGVGGVIRLFYSTHLVVPTAGGVHDASTMRAHCEAQSPVPGLLGWPLLPCPGASPPGRTVCYGRARCEAFGYGPRCVLLGSGGTGHGVVFFTYLRVAAWPSASSPCTVFPASCAPRPCTRGTGRSPRCLFPPRPVTITMLTSMRHSNIPGNSQRLRSRRCRSMQCRPPQQRRWECPQRVRCMRMRGPRPPASSCRAGARNGARSATRAAGAGASGAAVRRDAARVTWPGASPATGRLRGDNSGNGLRRDCGRRRHAPWLQWRPYRNRLQLN